MSDKPHFQRDGFSTITPYLMVKDPDVLIRFMQDTFGAELQARLTRTDETVMHAELRIGDSMIMVGGVNDEFSGFNGALYVYVPDCDAIYTKALAAGGTSLMEPTTMTHAGQRYGGVLDPTGNQWWIATHLEDLTEEEEQQRIDAKG